jgi:MOSC domain-containing protein YiiM
MAESKLQGRIVSVNLAQPRTIPWRGYEVQTGIYKVPVPGPIRVEPGHVVGDLVADLRVHGGIDKAVYAYPSEHYPWWADRIALPSTEWGLFGENLTTSGLTEDDVFIGDQFEAGEALLEVSQPRQPCFKFSHKIGSNKAGRLMVDNGKTGIYFRVLKAGDVKVGDPLVRVFEDHRRASIREINDLLRNKIRSEERLAELAGHPALPEGWREDLRARVG